MKRAFALSLAILLSAASVAPVPAHAEQAVGTLSAPRKLTIDRIEISGVAALSQATVESALEFNIGDAADRGKILRTLDNLKALYRDSGFESAAIRSTLSQRPNPSKSGTLENILEISVTEGLPTRIGAVLVTPDGLGSEEGRRHWDSTTAGISAKLGLTLGDALNRERVAAAKRAIGDALTSLELVGSRVDDPAVTSSSPPASISKDLKAARWVTLEFRVKPGDRATFGFRGNRAVSAQRLQAVVEEQRVLGFGKDYLVSIRNRIEEEYRALGYALVRVKTYTFERSQRQERHVTFEIQEGPRVEIGRLEFDGNQAFSDPDLAREFYKNASPIIQTGYYSEKDVEKAAELIIDWMKASGYLSAKLVTINTRIETIQMAGEKRTRANLIVYLYEWDQTIVRSIQISGNQAFSAPEIQEILGTREGTPLNLFAFTQGMEALKSHYRSKGYLGVRIENEGTENVIRYSSENRIADVRLVIEEGPLYRASRVQIEGLDGTGEEVVRRELSFREGDVLEESKITETELKLRRLGIFSAVAVRTMDDPEREGHKLVRISVQEGTPGVISSGIGYRNDLGLRAFVGWAYTNVLSKNHTLALDANVNRRFDDSFRFLEYQAQISYIWPWFLKENVTFRSALTKSARQYKTFDANTNSASFTWEKTLLPKLVGRIGYSVEAVHQFNAKEDIDNQMLTIGAVTGNLTLDLRDNPLAPTSGFFASGSAEYAAPWLLSQGSKYNVGYIRNQLRTDFFIPLAKSATWYFSFRMGFAKNFEEGGAIPLIKQFVLGGAGSLRGFSEQELNDQDYIISGTATYVNYRTQLDLPLMGSLRFGPFVDAGNLQHDTFSFGNLRYGAGFGFRYLTPVGPVNLDFGWKLDRRDSDREFAAVYFSIGVI